MRNEDFRQGTIVTFRVRVRVGLGGVSVRVRWVMVRFWVRG